MNRLIETLSKLKLADNPVGHEAAIFGLLSAAVMMAKQSPELRSHDLFVHLVEEIWKTDPHAKASVG
jgi:hypothetical protein